MHAMLRWLDTNYGHAVPALFARDTSDVQTLYSGWGFGATDPEYPHVYVIDISAAGPAPVGIQVHETHQQDCWAWSRGLADEA